MSDLLENGFQSQVKSDNRPQSSGKEKSIIKAAMPGTESAKSLTTMKWKHYSFHYERFYECLISCTISGPVLQMLYHDKSLGVQWDYSQG